MKLRGLLTRFIRWVITCPTCGARTRKDCRCEEAGDD